MKGQREGGRVGRRAWRGMQTVSGALNRGRVPGMRRRPEYDDGPELPELFLCIVNFEGLSYNWSII